MFLYILTAALLIFILLCAWTIYDACIDLKYLDIAGKQRMDLIESIFATNDSTDGMQLFGEVAIEAHIYALRYGLDVKLLYDPKLRQYMKGDLWR